MKHKNTTTKFLAACALLFNLFPQTALAEDVDTTKPFQFTCVVSAYYSPQPDQEHFSTGSYEDEIRLNGNGTNGADGTPVYMGMIAAPPEFPFGSVININGFGVGEVHDRGGAIKENRIDLWMGWGDEGLARALNWGKRTTTCTVYFPNVALDAEAQQVKGQFDLPSATMPSHVPANTFVGKNLKLGSQGEEVKNLQERLKEKGYYDTEATGVFDQKTLDAVIAFQKDMGIISSHDSYGAGYVGYVTWTSLNTGMPHSNVIYASNNETVLSLGDSGAEVSKLQRKLKDLGYFDYPVITGYYGSATAEAVYNYQVANNIVSAKTDTGAGKFGPVTRSSLYGTELPKKQETSGTILTMGSEGESVIELQEKLRNAGFFNYPEITGYYGQATEDAVYNFQLSMGIVRSKEDIGAGQFGPVTKNHLNLYFSDMMHVNPQVATTFATAEQKIFVNTEEAASFKYLFTRDLDYGATGDDVVALQGKLAELGYDTPGFYGVATKEAVIHFQLESGIIENESDPGAGVFGPATREKMNSL